MTESLPTLSLLAVLGLLHVLDYHWAWVAFGTGFAAFAVVFHLLPWTVLVARNFAAGYRGA